MTLHIKAPAAKTKTSKKPVYLAVKEDLIRRVLSGEWRPGELVPSEIALAQEYSVSVGTARKAVEQLVQDKIVVRQRGRGTTIATNKGEGASKPFRFLKFYAANGERTQETTYLECVRGSASARDAEHLNIAVDTPVVRLMRLRTAGNQPGILEHIVVREDICPNAAERLAEHRPVSISSFLDRTYNILIVRVDEKIHAALAGEEDIKHLAVSSGDPVLEVTRTAYDLAGRIVEYRTTHVTRNVYYANTTK
ncbi:GntR family transcriptional regulator [Acerihabitans sp.]|uniref:GntR family transcriptional regulator n=1 Tax=Acerihabitans sp. TaxID=2811394 RepID=UPI002EDAB936